MKPLFKQRLAAAVVLAAMSGGVAAQETSTAISGTVTNANGNPIAGSEITIINEDTGLTRTIQTGPNGSFKVRGLPVGENYTEIVSEEGFGTKKTEDLAISLGQTADLSFSLNQTNIEEVVVVASADVVSNVALGPSATFGLETLQKVPAINRNLTDVLRADPRVYVDESRGDQNAIQCGGANPRFNSLTLDGVRTNDLFGLNSNGYPTERIPFSYDAIEQVSVEFAPFDVEYGAFTACNINAVTKSGSNEFHGSVFYDYTDDSLQGDSLEGDDLDISDFDESRFGFTFGGPIIQDKLFFFVSYERLEGTNTFDRGAQGSGAVNEIDITQAELDEIARIARDEYGYDPGGIPSSFDNEDEKFLAKIDWNINDNHRASFTYNYNDGFNITESDGDLDEFEFSNHLYERGAELNSYVGTWYGNWTDRLSTEVRLSYLELENRQNSVGNDSFGEIRVDTGSVDVYLGEDDSRQSNELSYESLSFAFKAYYDLGNHFLTAGFERDELEVFNLFVQHTETEIRFRSIEDFENGIASDVFYNNAPSLNPADAAADWGYEFNSLYIQDDFDAGNGWNLVFGLRYDFYTSNDRPEENAQFVADYDFSNSTNLDGEGLLQPRFAFTWDYSDSVTVRGGVGLFSGGNPNVWLSNNFSNNNVLQFGVDHEILEAYDPDLDQVNLNDLEYSFGDGPGFGVPTELVEEVQAGRGENNEINYLDPDFKIPSEWKFALGATWELPQQYIVNADVLVTRGQDSAIVLRGDLERTGTNDDGYPIYESQRAPSFVYTNSDKGNRSLIASLSLAKSYDNGLDWSLGYAYSDAQDVQPLTSSVAFSNYQNRAFFDPQEQVLSTSDYNIEHRFTLAVNYTHYFWGDNATTFSLFGSAHQGPSYSEVVDGGFYNTDAGGFTFIVAGDVLQPGGERNSEDGSWFAKADIKVEQEFGGFAAEHKASAFLVIDNFTNLLNDEWGIQREPDFPPVAAVGSRAESRIGDSSLYEIRFGIGYEF